MTARRDALDTLHDAHEILERLNVPHGLIGGWAAIAWGRVRATRDVDWLAVIPLSRKSEILAALAPLGDAEWRSPGEDDPIAGLVRVVPQDPDEAVVDVLLAANAEDRAALSRCQPIVLGRGTLPAVRPEDIIAMKLQAGGGLDYEDARAILQIQEERLDKELLLAACRKRRVLDRLDLIRPR